MVFHRGVERGVIVTKRTVGPVAIACLVVASACTSSTVGPRADHPTPSGSVPPVVGTTPYEEEFEGVQIHRNLTYRTAAGVDLLLDVFEPEGAASDPAVMVIYGGGWQQGFKAAWQREALRLAHDGFVAFVPNYRLAPPLRGESNVPRGWHFPAPVEDLRAAAAWIRDNGSRFGADVARLGALGGSAGGNLALMLGTTGGEDERVDAVVAWSPPTNLTTARERGFLYTLVVENYLGCPYETCPRRWKAASPYFQVDRSSAPAFLANSDGEGLPEEDAQAMVDRLADAGVPAELQVVPGHRHSRAYEDEVWEQSVRFLREHLRP